jgi:predicted Zn-dependent peptidase
MGAAFSEHPIRVPILGTRESIRQITPEMLTLCHNAFYTPGNMLLCVVGDVEPEQVSAIALEILGDEKKEVGKKHMDWTEPTACPQDLVTANMEVAMPMFSMVFKCPEVPKGEADIRRETIGDLAAEALFGESSALYLRLYEEGLIDSSFGGGFEVVDGCSMLMISGDSDNPEAVRDAILAQAEILVKEGIPEEDFRRMNRSALGRRIKALDSFDSTCFRLCAYHMTEFDYFQFPRIHESVTAEEVRRFLAETIHRDNCALSVIYPTNQEENHES